MKYIFIALSFLLVQSAMTQNVTNEIIIHKDKPIYFIGDLAAYKVYLPNNVFEQGTVFNVRLTNSAGDLVQSHFAKVDDSASLGGYFALPFSYSADVYQAEYFVFDETAKREVSVAHTWIPLYDDLEPQITQGDAMVNNGADVMASSGMGLKVESGDDINISLDAAAGSISVQRKEDIPFLTYSKSAYGAKGMYSKRLFYTGKVSDQSGNILANRLIATYQSKNDEHAIMKTDENGGFYVQFDDFVEERSVQIIDLELSPVITKIIPPSSGVTEKRPSLIFTDGIIDLLKRKKEQRRINKYFGSKAKNIAFNKAEVNIIETPVAKKGKPYKVDNSYVFNDYKIFDDFAMFANEVTQNLFFRERDKKYASNITVFVASSNSRSNGKEITLNPFFILDGKITRDADYIGRLSQPLLEKVELEYDSRKTRTRYSLFGKEGIVRLYSKTGNLPIPQEELSSIISVGGLQDEIALSNHMASEMATPILDDYPYWQSDVNGGSISVIKPSDKGTYEVILVSRKNSGTGAISVSKKTITID